MYARFMKNTAFEIIKMFLASLQLAFRIYQIPIEHTVSILQVEGKIHELASNSIT